MRVALGVEQYDGAAYSLATYAKNAMATYQVRSGA